MIPSMSQVPVTDIAHAIQLSLAPVFLLNGIGVRHTVLRCYSGGRRI